MGNTGPRPDQISMEISDLHFPALPSRDSEKSSDVSSSHSSKHSYKNIQQTSSSKSTLLSYAQNAYHQQYDDAEGAQRWEEYKQKYSEQYLGSVAVQKVTVSGIKPQSVCTDDPAIVQAEVAKPRTGRKFPVRLLSNSGEEEVSGLISQSVLKKNEEFLNHKKFERLNSADLDETVLMCISQVHDELIDAKELAHKAEEAKKRKPVETIDSRSQAMSLPTIGLSAEAAEFVPRSKPIKTATTTSEPVESVSHLVSSSKTSNFSSVEIKPGVKNSKRQSPTVLVGSPLGMKSPVTVSPVVSPGISPPVSQVKSNSPASLTGSPMFITPKWPPPLYHAMSRPPPVQPPLLTHPSPRFVTGHHNPTHLPPGAAPAYGFPGSGMVYSVTPPTIFRVPGLPAQYVQHSSQTANTIEDQAVIATGQPIMATSEASRLISPNGKFSSFT